MSDASRPARAPDSQTGHVTIVTGQYGEQVLSPLLPMLRTATEAPVRLLTVRNAFFGGNIAVTGLLTGHDVSDALASEPPRVAAEPRVAADVDGLDPCGGSPSPDSGASVRGPRM